MRPHHSPSTPGAVRARIWVTFQRAGVHCYPKAPSDVSYLAHPHRHLFKFKVTLDVFDDDREIEFHQFLTWCESLYDQGTLSLHSRSCEMIGREIGELINRKYPGRNLVIEVSEDGECGAVLSGWSV